MQMRNEKSAIWLLSKYNLLKGLKGISRYIALLDNNEVKCTHPVNRTSSTYYIELVH